MIRKSEMLIKIRFIVLASMTLFFGTTFATEMHAQTPVPVILNVRVCDVFANPAKYDKRLVRVVVIHKESFEGNTIIDPRCKQHQDYVSTTVECETERECSKMHEKLRVRKDEENIMDGIFIRLSAVGTFVVEKYRKPMLVNDVRFHIRDIEHASELSKAEKAYLYNSTTPSKLH
jgi:hypothetical protein